MLRYSWDYENRLYEATNRKQRIRYRYDALGRRISRYVAGGKESTKFTYDGNDVVLDDNFGVITKYQNGLGIDNKLKMVTNGVSKYFLQDHLGSTTALTNSSGSVIESATYDSFGNATGNLSTRYQFTGREYDNAIGLTYYRARWYSSELGRFVSEDPIGLGGGDVNLFGYVGNNPANGNDPSGLSINDYLEQINESRHRAEQAVIDQLETPINFVAGFGDNASFGLTRSLRKWQGIDNANLDCSSAYQAGEWSAFAVQVAEGGLGIYKAGGKIAAKYALRNLPKEIQYTKSSLSLGRQIHNEYKVADVVEGIAMKEFRRVPGVRPDFVDLSTRTIYELKPYNPRGIQSGAKQLARYKAAFEEFYGGTWNTVLDFY